MAALRAGGAEALIELGPGKVLAGLCKRIDRGIDAYVQWVDEDGRTEPGP